MTIQIRNDINLITESIAINEAWQELPLEVREDLKTLVQELKRLDEAPLQPDQIQTVFSQMVTNRGEGGNTQQLAKKVQAQLTPLFAKITGNPKLKAVLSKVGNAVPIDGIKKMVAKLPDPAGKAATNVVAQIQRGAQTIENDEDVAAFKGMMMLVITIGMGAAGVGGPAMLGVIGTAAVFRTVVDSAIKAAAGGTVADVGKTAAAGLAKGAIAGAVGMAIGELANELFPPEVSQSFMSADGTEIDFNQLEAYNVADVSELTPESAGELLKAQGAFEQMIKSSAMDGADFTDEQIEIIKQANQDLADKITGLGGQDQLEELSGLTGSDLEQVTTARANITFADYEVQDGDNLSMIAYNNNVAVDDLVQANPDIEDLNNIQPGQTIKIPPNLGSGALNPDDISDLDALTDPQDTYRGGVGAGDDAVDQAAIGKAQDQFGMNAVDTNIDPDSALGAAGAGGEVDLTGLELSPEAEKVLSTFKVDPASLDNNGPALGELMQRSGLTDEEATEILTKAGASPANIESTVAQAREFAGPVDPSIDLDAPEGDFDTSDYDGDGKIDAIDKTVSSQGSVSAAELKQAGMNLTYERLRSQGKAGPAVAAAYRKGTYDPKKDYSKENKEIMK